jgi:hypothetical protein
VSPYSPVVLFSAYQLTRSITPLYFIFHITVSKKTCTSEYHNDVGFEGKLILEKRVVYIRTNVHLKTSENAQNLFPQPIK